ncbi:hypothetical protein BHE74_00059137, partial [Ensete ventricosum]
AHRNKKTAFLRLEFRGSGAGDEGRLDLSQDTFFCSGVCQGKLSPSPLCTVAAAPTQAASALAHRQPPCQGAATTTAGDVATPAGGRAGRSPPCSQSLPLRAGPGCGLAVGGRPYMGAGRPSSLLPSL